MSAYKFEPGQRVVVEGNHDPGLDGPGTVLAVRETFVTIKPDNVRERVPVGKALKIERHGAPIPTYQVRPEE